MIPLKSCRTMTVPPPTRGSDTIRTAHVRIRTAAHSRRIHYIFTNQHHPHRAWMAPLALYFITPHYFVHVGFILIVRFRIAF